MKSWSGERRLTVLEPGYESTAQCLDKLTPDAFVRRQWIQMRFWSGSQLMTSLLLLESPTGEPGGDASRYPFGIPGRGHRAGWSLGLSTCALVISVNL